MAGKRKSFDAEFNAKVALEAIRGDLTVAELVAKHGVHRTLINTWKRQATVRIRSTESIHICSGIW
ncbi:transposase [Frigidibacter sp. MR17.24]|uniref:transposase n=1 Tax=Frigidibacter sp. MR17.24 TaxID=3127345 RepID=UPI003012BCE2